MSKTRTFHDLVDDNHDGFSSGSPTKSIGTSNGLQDVIYLKEPGSAAAVSMGDIHQGSLSDCFVLGVMDEIARQSVIQDDPAFIPNIIHPMANGTENVILYQPRPGIGPWTPFAENVSNVFDPRGVNSGAGQATYGNQQEIWPQIIEKAYAQSVGGYNAIDGGGFPAPVMSSLTGQAAFAYDPRGSLTWEQMKAYTDNNDLVCFDTLPTGVLRRGLVTDHTYAFGGYVGSGANAAIVLQNPWGYNNPTPIPIAEIASGAAGIDQIDLGHLKFGAGHGVPQGAGEPSWFG